MRKVQKQEILNLISNFYQAHREIKEALSRRQIRRTQKMISECQEFAISLGKNIERLAGEGHTTVSCIEEYCECLFCFFEDLENHRADSKKILKILNRQLAKIESSVKSDITVRKEVVFFPYKASMWDSLESVYLAAKEDPDCDVYCVPIPYYELNPDHSFGEMHYEGWEYPKNIEIIDWQSYSFEERRPDEIYIHNPYDDNNLVTSVHPRFYSSNLKKYTEKLIYIPYFILGEIETDNQEAIDGMKHFIWLPGVINANQVIVQSEKMKQIYINEYIKAAKAVGLGGIHQDKKYLEKKILGLGSPKFDKILNMKKEDLEIPWEWRQLIEKPDGSCKKIVLYNTGITALLSHNEKWVEKIADVLKIFKENRDKVVLLWRPHPLIESTMRSMRPEILWQFLDIKNIYLSEGWGILDDTADMDRAVILSDAYYGDGSSVVQLYQKTGKPIMIQNMDMIYI